MKPKYLAAGLIAFSAVIGWNIFLIHRDQKLYNANESSVMKLYEKPSNQIK